ncbi:MAG: hypothetical protein KDH95_23485, partial [Calditrichaeota bacterium]|nr:hypothetical protein [Calditrichota bacterium]
QQAIHSIEKRPAKPVSMATNSISSTKKALPPKKAAAKPAAKPAPAKEIGGFEFDMTGGKDKMDDEFEEF